MKTHIASLVRLYFGTQTNILTCLVYYELIHVFFACIIFVIPFHGDGEIKMYITLSYSVVTTNLRPRNVLMNTKTKCIC